LFFFAGFGFPAFSLGLKLEMPPVQVDLTAIIILFHWQLLSHWKGITINWDDCSNNFIQCQHLSNSEGDATC
jgi:hypothetical protein